MQLDGPQLSVVEAGPDRRLVVSAGPGSGKTATLLARARWLETQGGVAPGTEIVILSFSRAAIEVLSERSGAGKETGTLPIRTFDSFASLILTSVAHRVDGLDYEGRIEAATAVLSSDGSVVPLVDSLRHVLVDESQDIVGRRAEFVLALLKRVCRDESHGCTVFGDAAQGIYGFDLDEGDIPTLEASIKSEITSIESLSMTKNYRTQSPHIRSRIDELGGLLRSADPAKGRELWRRVQDEIFLDSEKGWISYSEAVEVVKGELGLLRERRLAILCRTNLEVLKVGSELRAAGIDVRVQHRAQDRGAGAWLAEAVGEARSTSTGVTEAIARTATSRFPAPVDALVRLRRAGITQNDSINLSLLADKIRYGTCPESLIAMNDGQVTVSTVHRAKGLEFDVVMLAKPGREPIDDFLDETKVLFVGYSRAREAILACGSVDFESRCGTDGKSRRGTLRPWQKGARVSEVEVRVSDSDPDWIPEDRGEYVAIQRRIRDDYEAGDKIELVLGGSRDDTPKYDAVHMVAGKPPMKVGGTTRQFGEDICRIFGGEPPERLDGLTAELPDTASMLEAKAAAVGAPLHGIHLRARFFGLAKAASLEGGNVGD